ncbi:hypothetical protein NC796_02485 [Aliifodinibius sp. S!AR15-10]|uniref:hypothetical protein n=1 Tax=Aliifodinibius sp. S!AR15-10 TaxID=2950437 RepID=UPI00285C4C4C|nr:hypothetical protein [Aliifodinibius sp. S!AR15-10]MDR8389989.1 hypothetical protein [Aliifodinibius sp. S!AR15-10]
MNSGQLTLLKMALEYLADQPCGYGCYAKRIKSQVALMQAGGEPITMGDWVRMAKILSVEAISRDIGPARIAKTIYPLVDGLGQYAVAVSHIPAHLACNQLLSFTGTSVSPQVRRLLTDVIDELQKLVKANR